MDWWKKNGKKAAAAVLLVCILAFAFWYGGDAPGLRGWTVSSGTESSSSVETDRSTPPESGGEEEKPESSAGEDPAEPEKQELSTAAGSTDTEEEEPAGGEENLTPAPEPAGEKNQPQEAEPSREEEPVSPEPAPDPGGQSTDAEPEQPEQEPPPAGEQTPEEPAGGPAESGGEPQQIIDPETGKDRYLTDPVPEGKPLPVEPQDVTLSDTPHVCTLSVRCDTILSRLDWLDTNKLELVPEDGVIFPETEVTFYEGESVFNVLQREMKKAGIQMEFTDTPVYNSAYIEGIQNLYEFDCGELSGWMYSVNGWFPNYGCSRYQLKEGDRVCWVYTCDLGADVGGGYATGNGMPGGDPG